MDSCGGAGTAGVSGDSVNGAPDVVVDGRFDAWIAKKAGDLAMPLDGNAADFDSDAAADGDLVIGEDGGGLMRALGVLVMSDPAGKLEIARLADDLETVVQCGSSLEREKEADVDGALVSAVV